MTNKNAEAISVASATSKTCVRRFTSRFDTYSPLNMKMLCHATSNRAKSKVFPIEIFISKNCDSDLPAGSERRKKVAVRNAVTSAHKSYSFAVCFKICHLFETMGTLYETGFISREFSRHS